jgi:diguanylate cyclase (GGDEF)-like protein
LSADDVMWAPAVSTLSRRRRLPRSRGRSQRGIPIWLALAALMLFPLVAAGTMAGVSIDSASRSADEALRAEQLVNAVELLDSARRSVDAEVLPTMLLGVLGNAADAKAAGFSPPRREVLRSTEPANLDRIRTESDQALDAVEAAPGGPGLHGVLVQVRAALLAVRALADGTGPSPLQEVADQYATIAGTFSSAQRSANAEAISAGLSQRSVAALQDFDHGLALSEAASSQLAALFASRVLPEPGGSKAQQDWVATWGTYTQLAGNSDELSTTGMRAAWTTFQSGDQIATFSGILERQALDPREEVLETGALPGLAWRSVQRDESVAVLLEYAVSAVTTAVRVDRARAVDRERLMVEICLAFGVLSLLDVGLVARWLTVSMRSLAAGAQQISQGHLVDVPPRGPLELRTAAAALSSAVAGLRRVQEQAQAVVTGDLETALRQQPLPGPLGEVVHASVEQIVGAFRAREALQDELAHQASHDALTGLPNRAETMRHLGAALLRSRLVGRQVGLLFIDLDGFKAVNDAHGHAAGDELLGEVARRLSAAIRGGDAVGRLGGDEFVVTVENTDVVADLVRLAERIIAAVSVPVRVGLDTGGDDVKQVSVGASVGVTVSSDLSTADALLAEADTAAYRAKRLGRGRFEIFDDVLRAELAEQADLAVDLRQALDAGELRLHYQPVVDVRTGDLVGYEALARWTRPGTGPVRPDVFIAVAEASTLVSDLGQWVLLEATSQLAYWRQEHLAGFGPDQAEPTVAVNLSGRHLADPRVLDDVSAALTASGLPPELLVLEITETVLTNDPRASLHLQELRSQGVRVAIDDFGTGYTSIGALSTTPADILKIDRSFIASDDPGHHQLATLITRAAHTFSLRVVAEGIETPEQLARVRADGCEEAQGYLFSRPLPPTEVEELTHPLILIETTADPEPAAHKRPAPEWSPS